MIEVTPMIGRCQEFAANGCKVYATARRVEAMEGFTHEAIEKLRLDVTDDGNIEEAIKSIIDREGRIDVLVNNAGAPCFGKIITQTRELTVGLTICRPACRDAHRAHQEHFRCEYLCDPTSSQRRLPPHGIAETGDHRQHRLYCW